MGDNSTGQVVCVTGAGGYVASWLIKLLLSKGYIVHGTVRDPGDGEKNGHLKKLDGASQVNLKLFKADLLDYDSLHSAIRGCVGVFHVASPLPSGPVQNPQVELIEPALKGTLNVLKACVEAKVKRVIVVSSGAAVSMNPNWPQDKVKDESCWSDKDFQKTLNNWYGLSKTEAESAALEFGQQNGLDVVRVCPVLVLGPMLQSTTNSSTSFLIRLLKEGKESRENQLLKIVDVRDVADSLLLAYEKPEAEGRYICASYMVKAKELVDKLRTMYPHFNYPKSFNEGREEPHMTSEKLQKLGWKYRPLDETLIDSVESYSVAGLLG